MKIEIKRSSRRSLAVEIRTDCSVVVRAPRWVTDKDIESFVRARYDWITRHIKLMEERQRTKENIKPLTAEEKERLTSEALAVIPEKVRYFALILGVSYGRITIRNQKTRWGSCSAKGNLNFNYLLLLMPEEILDYVVVHELCHRLELNHSPAFWRLVEKVLPDYRQRRLWLKKEGFRFLQLEGI